MGHKLIIVLHAKGGVGKSAITQNTFASESIVNLDTQNSNNHKSKRLDAKKVDSLVQPIFDRNKGMAIDVGSPQYKPFMKSMRDLGAYGEPTSWMIIATPDYEIQDDAIDTINALVEQGVDKSLIKVVFNMVEELDEGGIDRVQFEEDFSEFISQCGELGVTINSDICIPETDLFKRLRDAGTSLPEMLTNDKNYMAMRAKEKSSHNKAVYLELHVLKRLCEVMDDKFHAIKDYVSG